MINQTTNQRDLIRVLPELKQEVVEVYLHNSWPVKVDLSNLLVIG